MSVIVFRAGSREHELSVSLRDLHLLDGRYFFEDGQAYRALLGLGFMRGAVGVPKVGEVSTFARRVARTLATQLMVALETQRDLVPYDYSYQFEGHREKQHGPTSGFKVRGRLGHIDVRPAGYCDLTVVEQAANGRPRIVEIIDMRVRREIFTDDRGFLRVYRKKAEVGWYDELPRLVQFLEGTQAETIEVYHPSGRR